MQNVKRPTPESREVLIDVHTAGLCGSDAGAFSSEGGYDWLSFPRIMGHEYSGRVVGVGDSVSEFEVGDKIVEHPVHNCGVCFQCKSGKSNVCQDSSVIGLHEDGAYAEYRTVDESFLHTVPKDVPLDIAAITEPTSVATRAVSQQSSVKPGDYVLVEGPGPIGALVGLIVDSIGANVMISGVQRDAEYRLPLLRDIGIETVNINKKDLRAKRDSFTNEQGFDVVFDTTGHRSGLESAVNMVRKGGEIVVIGLPGESVEIFITPVVRGEINIITSYGSMWPDFEQALRLFESGSIDVAEILDTSVSVENPEEAFQSFLAAKSCKPAFQF
jgi:L-iditol 2-dehydrogenase